MEILAVYYPTNYNSETINYWISPLSAYAFHAALQRPPLGDGEAVAEARALGHEGVAEMVLGAALHAAAGDEGVVVGHHVQELAVVQLLPRRLQATDQRHARVD